MITGPGRSGTSLVARVYKELGFDPGGSWADDSHAGLEDPSIVAVNAAIVKLLDLTVLGRAPSHGVRSRPRLPFLSVSTRIRMRAARNQLPWRTINEVQLFPWDELERQTGTRFDDLRHLASERLVAKDPQFCWTLPVWLAAGASIDHVVIATRNLDAMIASRRRLGHLTFSSDSVARNSLIYGLGLVTATVFDHRIGFTLLRFPDFTSDAQGLYRDLRFPSSVSEHEFLSAFARVFESTLIHDGR